MENFNSKWAEIASLKEPQLTWLSSEVHVLASLLSDWTEHSAKLGWAGLQYQLEPEHFATPEASFIYSVMVSMRDRAVPCDDLSALYEEIRKVSPAKPQNIMNAILPISDATTTNVNYWARNVLESYLHRELNKAITESYQNRNHETSKRVMQLEDALKKLKESEGFGDRKFVLIHHAIADFIEVLEKRIENAGKEIQALNTQWPSLDSKLKFGRGHFIVIGGRSGMGKTSYAFNLMHRMVQQGFKVGFFSLEHNRDEVTQVMLAIEANVSHAKMESGEDLTEDDLDRIAEGSRRIQDYKFAISDKSGATLADIKGEMEAMRRSMDGLDAVFIDHIHALGDDRAFKSVREKFIFVSGQLKAMASSFFIPIVGLAQMNRDADKRQDKRPQVSDLKESGSIEQDADAILFVYRDSYYASAGLSEKKNSAGVGGYIDPTKSAPNNPLTEVLCRKNRHGSYQNFTLHFEYNPFTKRFTEATLS